MPKIDLNHEQIKELSKALFNLGNIAAATMWFGQVIAHTFEAGIFIMGFFTFASCFLLAILLLNK